MVDSDTAFVALKLLFALSPLVGLGAIELILHLRDRRRAATSPRAQVAGRTLHTERPPHRPTPP